MWLPKSGTQLLVTHSCSCTLSCGTRRCGCRKIGLNCTIGCRCTNCQNNKGAGNYGQNIDEVLSHTCNCTLPCGNGWCHCRRYGLDCIDDCGCKNCLNNKRANRYDPEVTRPIEKIKNTKPMFLNVPVNRDCNCTTTCQSSICSCRKSGRKCIDSCKCIDCKNGKEVFNQKSTKFECRKLKNDKTCIDESCKCVDCKNYKNINLTDLNNRKSRGRNHKILLDLSSERERDTKILLDLPDLPNLSGERDKRRVTNSGYGEHHTKQLPETQHLDILVDFDNDEPETISEHFYSSAKPFSEDVKSNASDDSIESTQHLSDTKTCLHNDKYVCDMKFNPSDTKEPKSKLAKKTKFIDKSTMTEYSFSCVESNCKCSSSCGTDTCGCKKCGLTCVKTCKCSYLRNEEEMGTQCDILVNGGSSYSFSRIMLLLGILPLIIIGFTLLFQSQSNLQIDSKTEQNMLDDKSNI